MNQKWNWEHATAFLCNKLPGTTYCYPTHVFAVLIVGFLQEKIQATGSDLMSVSSAGDMAGFNKGICCPRTTSAATSAPVQPLPFRRSPRTLSNAISMWSQPNIAINLSSRESMASSTGYVSQHCIGVDPLWCLELDQDLQCPLPASPHS